MCQIHFLLKAEELYVILICLYSHLADGHLDCFLVLATMNDVTENMGT